MQVLCASMRASAAGELLLRKCPCKLLGAKCSAQVLFVSCCVEAFFESCSAQALCASCSAQKLRCASCSVEVFADSCSLQALCASYSSQVLDAICAAQVLLRKCCCASSVLLRKLLCSSCSAQCSTQVALRNCSMQVALRSLCTIQIPPGNAAEFGSGPRVPLALSKATEMSLQNTLHIWENGRTSFLLCFGHG